MSADNWGYCPKCVKEHHGLVPRDFSECLREDWDVGVDKNGEFFVSYSCVCNDCRFKFEFSHEEKLEL